MIDLNLLEARYQSRYADDQAHQHPEHLTTGRLMAELDDIVQLMAGAGNAEWTEAQNSTSAGRAYLKIKKEIANRAYGKREE